MNEAPKKIRITGEYDGNLYADIEYIRADLVDGLAEAIHVLLNEAHPDLESIALAALKALEEE